MSQPWSTDAFRVEGGMNEVDPEELLSPGVTRIGVNFECAISGSARKTDGYERFDGRSKPSAAQYYLVPFNSGGVVAIAIGNTVTGGTSGATGVVLENPVLTGGSWAGGDAVGTVVLGRLTGAFVNGEALLVAAVDRATSTGPSTQGTFVGDPSYKVRKRLAEADRRADIQKVPGSGPVRGVWLYNGTVYAFRDNVPATACVMYKATNAGWVAITLKFEVEFANGSLGEPADGSMITQGGVSAVVRRTCLEGGDWDDNSARGRFVIEAPAGGSFVVGVFTAGVNATCLGAQTPITLLPGGAYEFVNHNFYGASNRFRMYGVSGVQRGFEFDSANEVYAPIRTGMDVDTPDHVEAHRDYLFFSFPGGSVQNAGTGNPHIFTIRTGAGEFGAGDDVTAMRSMRGSVLAIMAKNSAFLLYGTSADNWDLRPWLKETGCLPFCLQEVGQQALAFDHRGAFFVEPTQEFGDFTPTMLTAAIDNSVSERSIGARAMLLRRKRGQVRIFFGDMTGVTGTFVGTKLKGWMPFAIAHQVACVASGEDSANGNVERCFAGTDDGYVMELDSGTNHDGAAVTSVLQFVASNQKMPNRNKVYHKSEFDIFTEQDISLILNTRIDYGRDGQEQFLTETVPGSSRLSLAEFRIDGEGVSIAQTLVHVDDIDPPFTVQVGRIYHTARGINR